MPTSRSLPWVLLVAMAWSSSASAQEEPPAPPEPWTLQLTFDHGLSLYRPPNGSLGEPRPVGSVDVRLQTRIGVGAMVRLDVVQLAFAHAAIEIGPSARGWLYRAGPRGVQLGGALGVAFDLWFDGLRPGLGTAICYRDDAGTCRDPYDGRAGPFATIQVDYREHAFLTGASLVARWLPHDLQGPQRLGEDFSIAVNLRVGVELDL